MQFQNTQPIQNRDFISDEAALQTFAPNSLLMGSYNGMNPSVLNVGSFPPVGLSYDQVFPQNYSSAPQPTSQTFDVLSFDPLVQQTNGIGIIPQASMNTQQFPFEMNYDNSLLTNAAPSDPPRSKKPKTDSGVLRCTCHNTSCLKCYCVCFKAGLRCSRDCTCLNCKNRPGNDIEIKQAMSKAKDAHPNAFEPKTAQNRTGCRCKKECKKNYCECKRNGFSCISSCTCCNCHNNKPGSVQSVGFTHLDSVNDYTVPVSQTFAIDPLQQVPPGTVLSFDPTLAAQAMPVLATEQHQDKKKGRHPKQESEDGEFQLEVAPTETLRNLPPRKRIKPDDDDFYKDTNLENITEQAPDKLNTVRQVEPTASILDASTGIAPLNIIPKPEEQPDQQQPEALLMQYDQQHYPQQHYDLPQGNPDNQVF